MNLPAIFTRGGDSLVGLTDVPDSPVYVLANNAFWSGWGAAKGVVVVDCFPCPDELVAAHVLAYAVSNPDMRRPRIVRTRPRATSGRVICVMDADIVAEWADRGSRLT